MANKEHKFFVLKLEDIGLYLTATERAALESAYCRISKARKTEGREPTPSYVVCNQDEPYAEAVWDLILKGEDEEKAEARTLETKGGVD